MKEWNCAAANNGHNGSQECNNAVENVSKKEEKLRRALGCRLYSDKIANPPSGARMDASSASGEGSHTPWGVGVSLPSICPFTGLS